MISYLLPREPSAEELELQRLPHKRLRCICQSYGVSPAGRKRELIERILKYEETHESSSSCWREGTPSMDFLFREQLH